ncbi:MAG: hypothetical protein ACK4K0_01920 [Flavobacteriales bacterium]
MNNKRKIVIVSLLLIALLAVAYFLFSPPEKKEKTEVQQKKQQKKRMSPYSTYILYRLMEDYELTASMNIITEINDKTLPEKSENEYSNLLIYINEEAYFDYSERDQILNFVSQGNQVFFASEYLDNTIVNFFFDTDEPFYQEVEDNLSVNYYHPDFSQKQYHTLQPYPSSWKINKTKYSWNLFKDNAFLSYISPMFISHTDHEELVCFYVSSGKGGYMFHSIPLAFSNLNMTSEAGLSYAERIFSHFPKSNIYWFNSKNKYSPLANAKPIKKDPEEAFKKRRSQLQYILDNPFLAWAFYLTLVGILLYLLFHSKRRQRVIPLAEQVENTTKGFVESVSHLYYQQGRHNELLKHKEKQFMHFIKQRYHMSSAKPDEDFFKKLALKSGIDEAEVKNIFTTLFRGMYNPALSVGELLSIHQKIETFYKNCK